VNGALRELSAGLCRGNFFAYRASVGMLARSSGASFRAGMPVLTDDVCSSVAWYLPVMFCLLVLVLSMLHF
jgi:hypothetical protein